MDAAEAIAEKADIAADFMSGLANVHRLRILCELAQGERSVTAIIEATGIAQTSVSQHLAKLKKEGIDDFQLHYALQTLARTGGVQTARR